MSSSVLPLPGLIEALRDLARPAPERRRDLAAALGDVATRAGAVGLRLELDAAHPLPSATCGYGTLAGQRGGLQRAVEGGQVWVDAPANAVEAVSEAVRSAVAAARAHLRAEKAEANSAALDAAVRGIGGVLSTERVLQLIVDRCRELVEAQYAALAIVAPTGGVEAFLTSGIDAETRARIGAPPQGRGLLGLIIRENRSIRIDDIAADPRSYGFPPHHPHMRSFLGVPIQVRGGSVGNLYLTNKRGGEPFAAEDQELVERFARHAGIAIENARLHERVQQLAVVEERERIGRELHDGIIQRIYAVNLLLDDVPELVEREPEEAAARVDRAIDSLNAAIAEIRNFIYILRPPGEADGDLGASLQALAHELGMHTTVPIEVEAAPFAGRLGGVTVREVLSIVREAVSNALRHAQPGVVRVRLQALSDALSISVEDDGAGFDPDALDGVPGRGERRGLVNMRERAEGIGGSLEVRSRPGAGTRIILTLPTRTLGGTAA
ncbi:MAG TPA: GAF domain-containing sensor histidine kinase [candidate division Zixibacteria bacterium]|nr:GAF domain-containing sensor histidine kinase [candidate division Zixibacteria bacterium]